MPELDKQSNDLLIPISKKVHILKPFAQYYTDFGDSSVYFFQCISNQNCLVSFKTKNKFWYNLDLNPLSRILSFSKICYIVKGF